MKRNIPNQVDGLDQAYEVKSFKNINGEGITAQVVDKKDNKTMEILCGNTKLMNRFEIFRGHEEIERNIQYLEGEGKTVVALAVNQVPQLIIALEEAHLAKPEARAVVEYL